MRKVSEQKRIDGNNNHIYLVNVKNIQEWMKKNNTNKLPSVASKDEEEKRLGKALSIIRRNLIKPYKELQTEEEKEEYKKKHPELEEVMTIVEKNDRSVIHPYIKNTNDIKEWMKKNNTNKLPSVASKDEEEKRLGKALSIIRRNLIKPYKELQTEEEKEEYKKKHPELEEVMTIVEEIDRNNPRANAKRITKKAIVEQKEKGELGESKQIEEIFKGDLKRIEKTDVTKDKNEREI